MKIYVNFRICSLTYSHQSFYAVKTEDGEDRAVECCGDFGENAIDETSELCLPIIIPPDDERETERSCINFVRSVPAPDIQCKPGGLEQVCQTYYDLPLNHILLVTQSYYFNTFQLSILR